VIAGLFVGEVLAASSSSSGTDLFGGQTVLQLLVLALGGALVVGNVLALARPPAQQRKGQLARPPVGRSVIMMLIGFVAALWAIATLTS
jgi:hypothetical protein